VKRRLPVALFALMIGTGVRAADPVTLTLQEALNLPSAELAARVLGATGELYSEVRRPYLGGLPGRSDFDLDFATAPRSAGFPGLCEADVVTAYFRPSGNAPLPNGAMELNSLHASKLYRAVSDTAPVPGIGNDAHGRRLEGLCASAPPVLIAYDPTRPPQPHFFRLGGPFNSAAAASFASRVLQRLFETAASGTADGIACANDLTKPDRQDCPAALAEITHLAIDRVDGFQLSLCYDDPSRLCVEAGFSRPGDGNQVRQLSIIIKTDARTGDPPPAAFRILGARVAHSTIVS
jgi:hypothetical protein